MTSLSMADARRTFADMASCLLERVVLSTMLVFARPSASSMDGSSCTCWALARPSRCMPARPWHRPRHQVDFAEHVEVADHAARSPSNRRCGWPRPTGVSVLIDEHAVAAGIDHVIGAGPWIVDQCMTAGDIAVRIGQYPVVVQPTADRAATGNANSFSRSSPRSWAFSLTMTRRRSGIGGRASPVPNT